MLFDGHGDVWTDVTCKRVDNHETDIFRKYHLKKFQAGKVTGGIFVIWIDPPYDKDPAARSKQIVQSIKEEMIDSACLLYTSPRQMRFFIPLPIHQTKSTRQDRKQSTHSPTPPRMVWR